MSGVEAFRLTRDDAVDYRRLMLSAYQRHPEAFTSEPGERDGLAMSWWERRMTVDPSALEVTFGVRVAGGLVGAVGVRFQERPRVRHKAHVFGMIVDALHRGRGIADVLLDAVLAEAHARVYVSVLELTVTEGNIAAVRLYERHGFVAWGVEPLAVAHNGELLAKVHMIRSLA